MRYAVVIHKDKDSAYGVTVPDIVGCFSAGDSIDEALANTREAIYAHLELVTADKGDIPEARPIEEHQGDADLVGGTWAYVEVDVEDLLGPAERINVTIPKRALQKIDLAAKSFGDTRSGLLTKAALGFIRDTSGSWQNKLSVSPPVKECDTLFGDKGIAQKKGTALRKPEPVRYPHPSAIKQKAKAAAVKAKK